MRTIMRAGAIALAASSALLGSAVAAQAAPAGRVSVDVGNLVLEPGQYGHTGSLQVTIRNRGRQPIGGNISLTDPTGQSFYGGTGTGVCFYTGIAEGKQTSECNLEAPVEPGRTRVITLKFRSPAKPQTYAQIAKNIGTVEFAGIREDFRALFRSTSGSLRHPRTYVQDSTQALTVTAGDVTLTRQADGTFAGRVPVTVRNNGDAANRGLWTALATPAGIDEWADIDPSEVCAGSGDALPIPPGGFGNGCSVFGGQLAEGEERSFEWVLTAPAETAAGSLGTATTTVRFIGNETDPQTDGANVDTFAVTVAG